MIKISNLEKSYFYGKGKEEKVLKGINAEFKSGQVNIIFGPSGCGKSTLLNIISGLDTKYTGSVEFAGQDIRNINLDNYRKDGIGFIFQNFNLVPQLTVEENVQTVLNLSKMPKKQKKQLSIEALDKLGMKAYAKKKPSELSGGQRQRVAIARAIVANPEVIVADEPTGALDTKTAAEVKDILVKLAKEENKTVIIVTHDRDFTKIADNVISMQDGKVVENVTSDIKSTNNEVTLTKNKFNIFKGIKNAFKNLSTRKVRTILTVVATSVGLIGMMTSQALGSGVNGSFSNLFTDVVDSNAILIQDSESLGQPNKFLSTQQVELAKTKLNEKGITKIEESSSATFKSSTYGQKLKEIDKAKGIETEVQLPPGFDPSQVPAEALENPKYAGNTQIQKLNESGSKKLVPSQKLLVGKESVLGEEEFYISEKLALSLLNKETATNDELSTLLNTEYKVKLTIEGKTSERTLKINGITKASSFATLNYLDAKRYQEMMDKVGQKNTTKVISGFAANAQEAQEISDSLKKDKEFKKELTSSTQKDIIGALSSLFSIVSLILTAVSALALIVAGVMILLILYSNVVERTKEIGIYRSLGYRKRNIRIMFIAEALVIGLIASAVSILITLGISVIVNNISFKQVGFNAMKLEPMSALIITAITLLICFVAALFPAFKASNLDPVESLRYE